MTVVPAAKAQWFTRGMRAFALGGRRRVVGSRGEKTGRPVLRAALFVFIAMAWLVWAGSGRAAEIVQTQVVDGTRVSFSLIPLVGGDLDRACAAGSVDERCGAHRIQVELSASETGRPIADADVRVNVAERSYAGEELRLERRAAGKRVWYEGIVDLPQRRVLYRVRVHFREGAAAAVREAEFEYRHHH